MIVILVVKKIEEYLQNGTRLLFAFLRKMVENFEQIERALIAIDGFFVDLLLADVNGMALLHPLEFLAQVQPKIRKEGSICSNSLDWREGLMKKSSLWICLSVSGSKEHSRWEKRRSSISCLFRVTRVGEHESRVQPPIEAHWSTGNRWISSSPETCFPGVSRCGKHESDAQTPRKPSVDREPMKTKFAGKELLWGISMRETRCLAPNHP